MLRFKWFEKNIPARSKGDDEKYMPLIHLLSVCSILIGNVFLETDITFILVALTTHSRPSVHRDDYSMMMFLVV